MSTENLDNGATETVASETVAPPPGGEAPASTPASAETAVREDEPPAEKPKRDHRAEKRISRLTQQKEAALEEAGYWRGIAEARAASNQPPPEPTVEGEAQPEKKQPPQPRDQTVDRSALEISRTVHQRITEEGKDIEDIDEVMETITARNFPINATIRDFLAIADHPAHLAQWMAENPDEVRRIAHLTPAVATRALEKRDAQVKPEKKATPNASRAPAPVPQVSGGGGVVPHSVERMSHDDLLKWTAGQLRR